MRASVVEIGFGPRERHAVVGREDHDRVVQLSCGLERGDDLSGFSIEALHLEVIIKDVAACRRCVRQEARDVDIRGLHAGARAAAFLVRTMRVLRAEPEGEWFVFRRLLVELGERCELVPGGIPRPSSGFEIPRTPPLPGEADGIARRLQKVRVSGELGGQKSPEVPAFFELMNGAPGEQRCARRRARRRGNECIPEQHTFASDPIEGGRLHYPVTEHAGVRIRPIVGNDHENIGTCRRRLHAGCDGQDRNERGEKSRANHVRMIARQRKRGCDLRSLEC